MEPSIEAFWQISALYEIRAMEEKEASELLKVLKGRIFILLYAY